MFVYPLQVILISMETVRPLIMKALSYLPQPTERALAIDFGIGGGDETGYLLNHGYSVIAIDNFTEFLDEVRLRKEVLSHNNHLRTIRSNFEEIAWAQIPSVDLFHASFSLCFVQPGDFCKVWENIVAQINPGGYFVGELYTHLQENIQIDGLFVSESAGFIPFFSEAQIHELLVDFETIFFDKAQALYEPLNEPAQEEEGIIYSVIARKKDTASS